MSAKCFVDTNILVYAHDRAAGAKYRLAWLLVQELWLGGNGALSTQVLQEFYYALRRKVSVPLSAQEARKVLEDYSSWEVIVNTRESVFHAISLESRYRISFWDGLILQAAERTGAEVLYTEDLSHGQMYGSVRVVNPLTASSQI